MIFPSLILVKDMSDFDFQILKKTLFNGFMKNEHLAGCIYQLTLIGGFYALCSHHWLAVMSSNNLQGLSVL